VWPREETEAGAAVPPPEGGSRMHGEGANGQDPNRPRAAISKFTFPSGSRPLEGYTIKRGVGIGGFGEVYFATSDAGKEVALKRIQRNLDIELRGVRQCLNLKHQNLVALFDIRYDEQEQAWVVMEYVPGASLKDIIDRHPTGMPIEDVHLWFRGLAAGTAYLHDHGIVHRDLKPGNVFDDDGIVKIGDYGLSKFISCSRRSGQTESVGTFHYMAPEIGKGNYGREIDIYALGIILHEMLTGNVPFDGESTQEIIMKHLTADPDVSRLAQPYRYVIQRALHKDPQKRFSSVYEMLDALGLASPSEIATASRSAPRALVTPTIETPPIAAFAMQDAETLFIGEDAEMVFGPVKVNNLSADASAPPPVSPPPGISAIAPLSLASIPASDATPSTVSRVSPIWSALDLENEPIAQIVRRGINNLAEWWNSPSLSTFVRIVVLIVAVTAIASAAIYIPALLLLFVGYAVYLGIRFSVNYGQRKPQTRRVSTLPVSSSHAGGGLFTPSNGASRYEELSIPPIVASPPRGLPKKNNTDAANVPKTGLANSFTTKHLRGERRAMLTRSLLFSSLYSIVLSNAAAMAMHGRTAFRPGEIDFTALATWLSVVTIASGWALIFIGVFFDPSKSPTLMRRIVLGATGALIACAAMGLQRLLLLDNLPTIQDIPRLRMGFPIEFSTVALFFGLFALIRWWKLTDPSRADRFRLSAVFNAAVVGGVLGFFVQYTQPWPAIIGAIIAISVQLGAARYSKQRKAELNQPFAIST
jgi:serine/threonine protein kinase